MRAHPKLTEAQQAKAIAMASEGATHVEIAVADGKCRKCGIRPIARTGKCSECADKIREINRSFACE